MTGLRWQTNPPTDPMFWPAAANYCSDLGGGSRLPSVNELQSIVDTTILTPGPLIDANAFPGASKSYYWTSSSRVNPDPNYPENWIVDFKYATSGTVNSGPDGNNGYTNNVRCVR